MGVRPMPDVAQGTLVQEHRRSEVGVLCANTSNQRLAPGVHRLNDPRGSISTLRNAESRSHSASTLMVASRLTHRRVGGSVTERRTNISVFTDGVCQNTSASLELREAK